MSKPDQVEEIYRASAGKAYLSQRKGATSEHVQSLRASLFHDLSSTDDTVLDFGCGTGSMLSKIPAKKRLGVEIGSEAAVAARNNGIDVFESFVDIGANTVDLAISFHAIEHVENPISIMREIARIVKPGRPVKLIVPGENPRDPRQKSWKPNPDMHLYTWTPLIFGNLAEVAGFENIRCSINPMPTKSRLVGLLSPIPSLSRIAHANIATKLNSWNVILEANSPN